MTDINKVIDFMEDIVHYLHSWLCTKDGHYRLYDIRSVRKAVALLLPVYEDNLIEEFMKRVNEGTIFLYEFPFVLGKEYERKLYETHQKNIKDFNKKYNYEKN